MRKCTENEITVKTLLNVVHTYTTRVKIHVVMGDAWLECPEAKRMKDFELTNDQYGYISGYSDEAKIEKERLLKYYGDCPVWNLSTFLSYDWQKHSYVSGIYAHCCYRDIRNGYLVEKQDIQERKKEEAKIRRRKRREKTRNEE